MANVIAWYHSNCRSVLEKTNMEVSRDGIHLRTGLKLNCLNLATRNCFWRHRSAPDSLANWHVGRVRNLFVCMYVVCKHLHHLTHWPYVRGSVTVSSVQLKAEKSETAALPYEPLRLNKTNRLTWPYNTNFKPRTWLDNGWTVESPMENNGPLMKLCQ